MVTIYFTELLNAFEFASVGGPHESKAFINLQTGRTLCISEETEVDEEVPEDIDASDRYLALPHKNDLELGRRLALLFIEQHLPIECDKVAGYFHKRGAYGKFKDLLDHRGLLEAWFVFEKEATERALKHWCEAHEIQLNFSEPAA